MVKLKNYMKICLIGYNLTSLILAQILSEKKFHIEIYSSKSFRYNYKTRSLGITNYNTKYLSYYFKNISKKINPINEIKVSIKNNKINEEIIFKKNTSTLFNMIKYDKLNSLIISKVTSNKYIRNKYIKKNSDLQMLIDDRKYDLILNCESSNFLTKNFLKRGISKNYLNKAFTTILTHKKINNNKAIQVFTEFGPIAFLPLSNKITSVVFSYDYKKNQKITENEIKNLINKFNPFYKILNFEKFENFNLNLKLPKKYYYKNVLFFGDSIHSIHPLAGQGFNMSIRDIIRINQIIDKKINLGLKVDKNIYKEFESQSKSYNTTFSFGVDLIHEFFKFERNFLPKKISENIYRIINKNQKIKDIGIKLANKGSIL